MATEPKHFSTRPCCVSVKVSAESECVWKGWKVLLHACFSPELPRLEHLLDVSFGEEAQGAGRVGSPLPYSSCLGGAQLSSLGPRGKDRAPLSILRISKVPALRRHPSASDRGAWWWRSQAPPGTRAAPRLGSHMLVQSVVK